jgi:hypothetical protein
MKQYIWQLKLQTKFNFFNSSSFFIHFFSLVVLSVASLLGPEDLLTELYSFPSLYMLYAGMTNSG